MERTEAAERTSQPSDATRTTTAVAGGWTVSPALVLENICESQVIYANIQFGIYCLLVCSVLTSTVATI
jgi:hypothetical protein